MYCIMMYTYVLNAESTASMPRKSAAGVELPRARAQCDEPGLAAGCRRLKTVLLGIVVESVIYVVQRLTLSECWRRRRVPGLDGPLYPCRLTRARAAAHRKRINRDGWELGAHARMRIVREIGGGTGGTGGAPRKIQVRNVTKQH